MTQYQQLVLRWLKFIAYLLITASEVQTDTADRADVHAYRNLRDETNAALNGIK